MAAEKETKASKPGDKDGKTAPKKGVKKEDEAELSEEDQQLKSNLELMVTRVGDVDAALVGTALQAMRSEIRAATTSMTSVPKPLKFLRPHYAALKARYESIDPANKGLLADVLSVLAMTMGEPGKRECLHYRLANVTTDAISAWGHEYTRHLAAEIADEYPLRREATPPADVADLLALVDQIAPYYMQHNAEPDACDLLMEVEQLDKLVQWVDRPNHARVCNYLVACSNYVPEPEHSHLLRLALATYRQMSDLSSALVVAMKLNDLALIKEVFNSATNRDEKRQLAFQLARQRCAAYNAEEDAAAAAAGDGMAVDGAPTEEEAASERETLAHICNNELLSPHFLELARELHIQDVKSPEDIYKVHLESKTPISTNIDSARQNLASTFVNGFVNAGFGKDKLMTDEGNKWLYKNKDHGIMSAAASLGLILMWDLDTGLQEIDKYLYSGEDYIKAGALLAFGIVSSGVVNDCDPALALLGEYVDHSVDCMRICAVLGLGLAYAGTRRAELSQMLTAVVEDPKSSIEVAAIAALSLGLVFCASCDDEVAQCILQTLMDKDETQLKAAHSRFFAVGLGLLFLGKQEAADNLLVALETLPSVIRKYAQITLETCAFTATGNVLRVQSLLQRIGETSADEAADNSHLAVAVVGLSMISMGEELGSEMCVRTFEHLLQYGEPVVRRSVPLALALNCISNPVIGVMDTLSKLSHDHDTDVAAAAILSLGLIGAGTNNSRIAGMLRALASYYHKEPNQVFLVRLAQGLLHMAKGTMTLNPFHANGLLMSPVATCGLIATLHACFDLKNLILGKSHYLLYLLVLSMHPRMLMTFDENLKPLSVNVRVGQAVDTIGQAGRPKSITGFQTHTTPVLLAFDQRAELATDDYTALSSTLEGFVILRKNPEAANTTASSSSAAAAATKR